MGFAGSAQAVPVQWTLQNMTFSNGSVATGSFVYDRDTNIFSDISISVTAGLDSYGTYGPSTFDAIAPYSAYWLGGIFTTLSLSFDTDPSCTPFYSCGTHGLYFVVSPSEMTNAGGTLAVSSAALLVCDDDLCNNGSWSFMWVTDELTTGSITAVPEAETWAMMLAGLGLVGWMARRRAS